jgi:hypothetical protein
MRDAMRRALALTGALSLALSLALMVAACAQTGVGDTPITGLPDMQATGDFDGDSRTDRAAFIETETGVLALIVRRAAAPNAPLMLWGGDISSLPYYTVRTAPPGHYVTACALYGGCGDAIPAEITLTHDGLFVLSSEHEAKSLYFWENGAFRDILLQENAH